MNKEISSMLFTDVNGEWKRIYTSEEVIENLQNDKAKLQQRINKAINYINTSIKPLDTKILNNNEIDTLLEILEK